MQNNTRRLSAEAAQELRAIYEEEFDDILTDFEIEEMGMGLLRLFTSLVARQEDRIPITEQEFKALQFIHHSLFHDNKQPSVRKVTEALGRRSPRSGFRMLNQLIKRNLIWRDAEEKICMVEGHCEVWGCDV